MDPNECLKRWREATAEQEYAEMAYARKDLCDWLRSGGFWPEGMDPFELMQIQVHAKLRPPQGYKAFSAADV